MYYIYICIIYTYISIHLFILTLCQQINYFQTPALPLVLRCGTICKCPKLSAHHCFLESPVSFFDQTPDCWSTCLRASSKCLLEKKNLCIVVCLKITFNLSEHMREKLMSGVERLQWFYFFSPSSVLWQYFFGICLASCSWEICLIFALKLLKSLPHFSLFTWKIFLFMFDAPQLLSEDAFHLSFAGV